MAKKKRDRQDRNAGAAAGAVGAVTAGPGTVLPDPQAQRRRAGAAAPSGAIPAEAAGVGVVALLSLMMFLAPALGVPHEEMLQDTLKSIVVSFCVLSAALLFFWGQRDRRTPLRWHAVIWLPLGLLAYALGSMAWSHTYLAAVESVRWFVFALLVWLGANVLTRERLPALAWGIHAGAVVASLWAALQFWIDFNYFPQGPNPASTFINRNFFAEFAVCTLPFAALLLARARQSATVAVLSVSTAFVIVAILMTGTRGALIALWLQLFTVFPIAAWLYRRELAFMSWSRATRVLAMGLLAGTVLGLGSIPTGNSKISGEERGNTALERGFKRTASIAPGDDSLGVRMIMWKATARLIQQRPLTGVGAGAWESDIPLYQAEGAQLETDYYVHNEFLQLLAEYGLVGWLFLAALAALLVAAAWRTLEGKGPEAQAEGPSRVVYLCSLLAFLIVSNVGFPWRMASTGALFALCLAGLAASDARLGFVGKWSARPLSWNPNFSRAMLVALGGAFALALYISQQAAEAEYKIVHATRLALTITASGNPNSPRWTKVKEEMLHSLREGIAINPHYRKITPITADELARWGDWKDATWIWESVLSSRPHVVAMLTNAARGHASTGNLPRALELLERAKKIQPRAPAVRSLEIILLSRKGDEAQALELARQAFADNLVDFDLVNTTFYLAYRARDFALAERAIRVRMTNWPNTTAAGFIQLGSMYSSQLKNPEKALEFFKQAMMFVPESGRKSLLQQIPPAYWPQLGFPDAVPSAPPPHTSASKG